MPLLIRFAVVNPKLWNHSVISRDESKVIQYKQSMTMDNCLVNNYWSRDDNEMIMNRGLKACFKATISKVFPQAKPQRSLTTNSL